jgi:hypothetical protein
MAEVSANCGEQAADIGRNALSHVKKSLKQQACQSVVGF